MGFARFSVQIADAVEPIEFSTPSQAVAQALASDGVFEYTIEDPLAVLPNPSGSGIRVTSGIQISAGGGGIDSLGVQTVVRSAIKPGATLLDASDVTVSIDASADGIVLVVDREDLSPGEYGIHVQLVGLDDAGQVVPGSEQPIVVFIVFSVSCGTGERLTQTGTCAACAPGTFSAAGATECTPCPVTGFQDEEGQGECKVCAEELPAQRWLKHSSPGQSSPCPVCDETAVAEGTDARSTCVCPSDSYEKNPSAAKTGTELQCAEIPVIAADGDSTEGLEEHSLGAP